jgi:hypothetical protein
MKANTLKKVVVKELGIERRSANIRLRAEQRVKQLEDLVTYSNSISEIISGAMFHLLKDVTSSENVKVKTTLCEFAPSRGEATICFQFQDLHYETNAEKVSRYHKFEKFAKKHLQFARCVSLLNKYFVKICGKHPWSGGAGNHPIVELNGRKVRLTQITDGSDDFLRAILVEVKFDKI